MVVLIRKQHEGMCVATPGTEVRNSHETCSLHLWLGIGEMCLIPLSIANS